ncbi:MAG: hypothetical protein ACRD4S_13510 [Candidatus Acidiferrales bacterium]
MTPRSHKRSVWAAIAGVPVLFAAIAMLQMRIDSRTRAGAQEQQELMLRSGAMVKKMSLGYESLLADIYWTRAVQYWGAQLGVPHSHYDLLWPLLDITTTLDPHLIVAYRFGAIFLSEPDAGARRPDLAVELVKRGVQANPGNWHLKSDLGFLYYWHLHDYKDAAATYFAASKDPQAPAWLAFMAARISDTGGSIDTSRMIWTQIYNSTDNATTRKKAVEHLAELQAEDDERHLNALAEQYRQRFGHYPSSTRDLRDAGMIRGIPRDPAGFPYEFDAEGRAQLDLNSTIPTPDELDKQKKQ